MVHGARDKCLNLGSDSPGDNPGSDLLVTDLAPLCFISLISKTRIVIITLQDAF